jgi:hypothetical protein
MMFWQTNPLLKTVRNKSFWRILFTIILSMPLIVGISFSPGPSSPTCVELGNCDFFESPFDSMLLPYTFSWGVYIYPAVWGLIVFIIWLRAENPFIPAIIGVALALFIQSVIPEEGRLIGWALLAFAIAVALFQIVTTKPNYPIN